MLEESGRNTIETVISPGESGSYLKVSLKVSPESKDFSVP